VFLIADFIRGGLDSSMTSDTPMRRSSRLHEKSANQTEAPKQSFDPATDTFFKVPVKPPRLSGQR
jgi:hypothetical protein